MQKTLVEFRKTLPEIVKEVIDDKLESIIKIQSDYEDQVKKVEEIDKTSQYSGEIRSIKNTINIIDSKEKPIELRDIARKLENLRDTSFNDKSKPFYYGVTVLLREAISTSARGSTDEDRTQIIMKLEKMIEIIDES